MLPGCTLLGSRERITEFVEALERGVIAIVAPLLLPGVLLAAPFFRLWLGEQGTREVVTVFRILWIAFCIPAFSIPVSTIVAAHGKAGLPAQFATLTAIVVVIAIAVLVPRWGATRRRGRDAAWHWGRRSCSAQSQDAPWHYERPRVGSGS